jgi:hypothetical protein
MCSQAALSHLFISLFAEDKRMYSRVKKSTSLALALAFVALLSVALSAQTAKSASKAAPGDNPSKWDIFLGYSFLDPKGTVTTSPTVGTPTSANFDAVNVGGLSSVAYYFNRHFGVQGEFGVHEWGSQSSTGSNIGTHGNDDGFLTVAGGLIARYPTGSVTPFVHGLVGTAMIDGPNHQPYKWGPALTAGGGMDYETPLLNHRLAIRLFQADYEYMHADWGTGSEGGRANINAVRLSAGVVFRVGSIVPPPPVTLACSASPESVFPGEPVTVTATAGSLDPKLNAIYSWSGTGASGTATTTTIATGSLDPGSYSVKGNVKEGKAGKEGLKPGQSADCSASFTVKAFEPPTISCSVSPNTIKPGENATVTSTGMSPQNRPLTYSYSATGGTVTGTGTTAEYSSAGAPTGVVGITCNVADDKNHSATSNTSLTIVAPVIPPAPHTQALCSISFATDTKRPTRVDNEAKACLDQVALDLQQQADAKAVVVGESNGREKDTTAKQQKVALKHKKAKVELFDAQRAVNAKDYLVTEKGIDASRVSVATGTTDGQTVEDYLVPAGATFAGDVQGTTAVDESTVKPEVRKPLAERHPAKKAAKAK